jgi:outer membrane protein assembly factor BamB
MCVDRESGRTLWQKIAREEVPHEGHHPDGSFASASATTDGKRVYVSFGSRGVYCYDMAGEQKWTRDFGHMTIFNRFGEGTSPVVHGDSLVLNWDHQGGSNIMCLDAATGETRWKVDRDETTTWATPLLVDRDGRTQVITHGVKRVRSYDLKTGELIWACGGQGPSAIPCPVTDGKLTFAMTGFMLNTLTAIPLDSSGDITQDKEKIAWKRNQGTPYVPSPLLYGDLLYFTSSNKGILTVLKASTGEPLVDRQRLQGIQNIYASPVGAAGRVYLTSREGNTLVIKHGEFERAEGDEKTPGKPIILATNKLDDRFDASPVVIGNQMILRGREYLYCISAQ